MKYVLACLIVLIICLSALCVSIEEGCNYIEKNGLKNIVNRIWEGDK